MRFIFDRHCGFKTERFVVVVPRLSAHEFNEILLSFLVQDGTDKKLHTHQTWSFSYVTWRHTRVIYWRQTKWILKTSSVSLHSVRSQPAGRARRINVITNGNRKRNQYQHSCGDWRDGVPPLPPVHITLTVSTPDSVQKPRHGSVRGGCRVKMCRQ